MMPRTGGSLDSFGKKILIEFTAFTRCQNKTIKSELLSKTWNHVPLLIEEMVVLSHSP